MQRQFLAAASRVPLERGKWLWRKDAYVKADRFSFADTSSYVRNLSDKLGDSFNVFHCFARKPDHKVKLDVVPAACVAGPRRFKHLFVRDVFIDKTTQPLASGFRRKGQRVAVHVLEFSG